MRSGTRSGAAAGHRGYFHECAFYGSEDEFLAVVIPFLQGGLEAGEPTFVAFDGVKHKLIRSALSDCDPVVYLDLSEQYARPATTIKLFRGLLAEQVALGARQIRVVGDVPHPGVGAQWDWWARYEATVNLAYDDFPIWGLCPYDTRTAPAEVLADVELTHRYVVTAGGGRRTVAGYEQPAAFLRRHLANRGDLNESTPPAVELVGPSPLGSRQAVLAVAGASDLPRDDVDGLVVATSEAVTNAHCHGRPPVLLRVWGQRRRVVVTVTDHGDGPENPFVGLAPPASRQVGGLGLWLAHQMCSHVSLSTSGGRFTVRLVAGHPGY